MHLLLGHIFLVLCVLLDEFSLLSFQVTDRLVNVHFLLVVGGLIFDSLVEEKTELVCLMNAINKHGQQYDFLLVAQLRCEISRFDSCEFFLDLDNLIIKWSKDVWLLTSSVH